jgi:hypothetical protein
MHFNLGWLGTAGGFGHKGYQAGDDHYVGVGQQQTRQANCTVQNAKLDHPIPPKTIKALGQPHK